MKRLLFILAVVLFATTVSGQRYPFTNSAHIAEYPSILDDGNTEAWYIADVANYTTVGDTAISQWDDESGNGNHLAQATTLFQPLYSGDSVMFDGALHWMYIAMTGLEQPTTIYLVVKQVSWTSSRYMFDGSAGDHGAILQNTSTPNLLAYAGTDSDLNSNLAVGDWGIVRVVWNGASSSFQIDETTIDEGDFGSDDMGGFQLGSRSANNFHGNFYFKHIIIRSVADDATDRQTIYDYLEDKHGL